jgi:DNA gyrase/topoisomerase IV subunit A
MLKIILIAYGLSAIVTHGRIFARELCLIGRHSRLLYEGVNCMQCVGFWSGLVVSLILGYGWQSVLLGLLTSGTNELIDIVTKKIENMTEYEFQLRNENSELNATINGLRAELKQREEANEELSAMLQDCQKKLAEALKREKIAKKVIAEKRKENV